MGIMGSIVGLVRVALFEVVLVGALGLRTGLFECRVMEGGSAGEASSEDEW